MGKMKVVGGSGAGMGGEQRGYAGLGRYVVRGRKGRGFLGDIGIEYGFRIVVMIELGKRVRVERKEEGYRDVVSKK